MCCTLYVSYPDPFMLRRLETFMVIESTRCCSLLPVDTSRELYPMDELMDEVVGGGDTRGTMRTDVPFTASV